MLIRRLRPPRRHVGPRAAGSPPRRCLRNSRRSPAPRVRHGTTKRGLLTFLHFVRRPRLGETLLKIVQAVGANCATLTAQGRRNVLADRARDLSLGQRPRNLFRQPQASHSPSRAIPLLDIVVDLHIPIANQRLSWAARRDVREFRAGRIVEVDSSVAPIGNRPSS